MRVLGGLMREFNRSRLWLSDLRQSSWTEINRRTLRASPGFALRLLKFACVTHLIFEYVGGPRMVAGPSMLPTMSVAGDIVIEDSLTINIPSLRALKRGDLVVLTSPRAPREQICKRIIGLPGDIICVDPTGEYAPSTEHVVIPKGHMWIIGDNASMSRDSRLYGPVPMALVRGRVVARISPWRDRTIFRNNETLLGTI